MTSFVALYRGPSIGSAKLIGVSGDAELVAGVANRLLGEAERATEAVDPVLVALERGRRSALRLVRTEAAPRCLAQNETPTAATDGAPSTA